VTRRLRRFAIRLMLAGAAALAGLVGLDLSRRGEGAVTGRPHVADGDTLAFGEVRVRLEGIDACELGQTAIDAAGRPYDCGARAREALRGVIAGRPVTCDWNRRDRYGRRLGRCRAGGEDLGAAMTRAGQARAYWQGGTPVEPAYVALEAAARLAGRGVWAGEAADPKDWRRDRGAEPFWADWF
jgi:endonuclease YncB( thermonuclease family)